MFRSGPSDGRRGPYFPVSRSRSDSFEQHFGYETRYDEPYRGRLSFDNRPTRQDPRMMIDPEKFMSKDEYEDYISLNKRRKFNQRINVGSIILSISILVILFLFLFENDMWSNSLKLRRQNSNILNYLAFAMIGIIGMILIINFVSIALSSSALAPKIWTNVIIIIFNLLFTSTYTFFAIELLQFGNTGIDSIILVSILGVFNLIMYVLFGINLRN